MSKPQGRRPPPSGRTNLASCIVATIFLIFIVIVILIVYFTVFKPKDPKIAVNAVQLPSFAVSNGTANFTFSQYVAVRNPNRATFSHYDSTLQLIYSGGQVGFMFIPAGKIEAGQTQYMAATFAVKSFPVSDPRSMGMGMQMGAAGNGIEPGLGTVPTFPGNGAVGGVGGGGGGYPVGIGPTLEIESKMEMAGRIRVLHIFTHHVNAKAGCKVAISVSDGSVLGFHC
ncbi:uncharacterized protein LOC107429836 [Ziziphus jujuba]|uniref:Uncharacterized protein LOC107429836 n=2 Tax=Ziziphus jujuba TaxID=326968 RepID=A0A6P4B2E4_ZIZJJ|nr:uncharacterized protein LOC107429836 [Ziziphus jujuba]KAH7513730.1 hypothetical protein FEM48_Zijuj11G0012200 [Ziziphus jujuba var. spinosa]